MKFRNACSMGLAAAVLLLIVTFGVYHGVLDNGFLESWDDSYYVTHNSFINSGFSVPNVSSAFTEVVAHNWHPITMLSHMLDVELFGLAAAYHHGTNLLLHCGNTLLVYLFLLVTTKKNLPALLVALIFGVHPLHVESVAWVSERKDLLSSFFILMALIVYCFYTVSAGIGKKYFLYAAMCCLYLLGLLSKSMVVTFPFLLLIVDYWPLNRFGSTRFKVLAMEKLPLVLFSGLFVLVTLATQKGVYPFVIQESVSAVAYSYGRQFVHFFIPVNQSYLYSYSVKPSLALMVAGAVSIATVLGLIFAVGKRYRFLVSGVMMYVVLYLPVSGIIRVGSHLYADRYMYLPMLGLTIATVYGITARVSRLSVILPFFTAIIAVLGCLTFQYEKTWNSQFTLYRNALTVGALGHHTKEEIHAHAYLAECYYKSGDIDAALPHLHNVLIKEIRYTGSGVVSLSASEFYELSEYAKLILEDYLVEDVTNTYNILAAVYVSRKDFYNALVVINRGLAVQRNNTFLLEQKRLLNESLVK